MRYLVLAMLVGCGGVTGTEQVDGSTLDAGLLVAAGDAGPDCAGVACIGHETECRATAAAAIIDACLWVDDAGVIQCGDAGVNSQTDPGAFYSCQQACIDAANHLDAGTCPPAECCP